MDEEGKIDLVKSAIGQQEQSFVVKAGGPDELIGTCAVPGFDIRCGDREIRFGFHPIEKMTKAQDHTIIVKLAGNQSNP